VDADLDAGGDQHGSAHPHGHGLGRQPQQAAGQHPAGQGPGRAQRASDLLDDAVEDPRLAVPDVGGHTGQQEQEQNDAHPGHCSRPPDGAEPVKPPSRGKEAGDPR
jgi:hypothetical protein